MSPATYSKDLNRISKGISNRKGNGSRRQDGFTLIELLAVIAIIALLAGIVLSTAGIATFKSRESRMRAEHGKVLTAIESYKLELGTYPPDNQTTGTLDRYERAGKNSLYYELSGCTFKNDGGGTFVTQNQQEEIRSAELRSAFGVNGVDNSARNKKDVPYRGVSFRSSQIGELADYNDAEVLIVPLPGPHQLKKKAPAGSTATPMLNPFFYDASSTNRNNADTFDLWTEYTTRDGTKVIGNWKN
ncbi:MAG TPA: type II secretion system protein [Verrucomicrobiae bacterium]|nr:type II secretion system protein [Verrucomicrobiae bacterium]